MNKRANPVLHRDDPDKAPLHGHVKVTREDWLNVARDALVNDGVGEVKVLTLGERLGVSRSSFYWYFKSRKHLLEALLDDWEQRNTQLIITNTELPALNITEAACNFFRCFVDPSQFDQGLDFAVREWSRRETSVRLRIDAADTARIAAVVRMFQRHGYSDYESDTRARIIYFMQLGYHALEVRESMKTRMGRLEGYLLGFTGVAPDPEALKTFIDFAQSIDSHG
ncbi:TetR/AcrR family transcriptional regulator [uncultured Shimia sp.]|uniref:TetR/AcrR family transcriptional regulator n=1 Tax=uncultured Shimia sp. TaxID=573152 RepID=UPI00260FD212|nr:TetR/AcrR family transcriptional regulator [uncultured Shimia sp.]